eukprot:5455081-Pyramimonas_sp.AAC.1
MCCAGADGTTAVRNQMHEYEVLTSVSFLMLALLMVRSKQFLEKLQRGSFVKAPLPESRYAPADRSAFGLHAGMMYALGKSRYTPANRSVPK